MRIATICAELGIRHGIQMGHSFDRYQLTLGGGSLSMAARPDRYAPPDITDRIIANAYPLVRGRNVFLAKDRRPDRQAMLVLVRPRVIGRHVAVGSLRLDLCSPGVQEVVRVTGPRDFYQRQDGVFNIAWIDSLVVMWPGDFIVVLTEDGRELRAQYGDLGLTMIPAVEPRLAF